MLLPTIRTFLYLQIGEEVVKRKVGVWGIQPLIAAVVGPFFLFFFDFHTREQSGGPDIQHWKEISAHAREARDKNIAHLEYELDQIYAQHKPLLEIKEESRDPHQVEGFSIKTKSIMDGFFHRQNKIDQDAFNMSILAVEPQEKVGSVTELSDRIKDFLRGKEKNRSLWVIDRGVPGGLGLEQYDQTLNPNDQTLNPNDQTLNPNDQTLNSNDQTLSMVPQHDQNGENIPSSAVFTPEFKGVSFLAHVEPQGPTEIIRELVYELKDKIDSYLDQYIERVESSTSKWFPYSRK